MTASTSPSPAKELEVHRTLGGIVLALYRVVELRKRDARPAGKTCPICLVDREQNGVACRNGARAVDPREREIESELVGPRFGIHAGRGELPGQSDRERAPEQRPRAATGR